MQDPGTNYWKIANASKPSILLIGCGWMGAQYAQAFSALGLRNVTVMDINTKRAADLAAQNGFQSISGELKTLVRDIPPKDLVIVATSVSDLLHTTKLCLNAGWKNLLVEKPAALYSNQLRELEHELHGARLRVGYNRILYPNFLLLKKLIAEDGGATSCTFNFTEWTHTLDFSKDLPSTFARWGIVNALHVISMVTEIIGFPEHLNAFQTGSFEWHPSGSCFVGAGISEHNIPFSYQADWQGGGRWAVDFITTKNIYRLVPLENLSVCEKGRVDWKPVEFRVPYPDIKFGLAEQISLMLQPEREKDYPMVSLDRATRLVALGEKILGYPIT